MFNVNEIRNDFPILNTSVNGKTLIYLDNAATMQMPAPVLDEVVWYYSNIHANVHRGIHSLSERATSLLEESRAVTAAFVHALSPNNIIFTSGTTQSVNMAARSLEGTVIKAGDEILVSGMEHYSNLIPWQKLCQRIGASLKIIPVGADGTLSLEKVREMVTASTKLIAVCMVSNVLGTVNPIYEMADIAHSVGAYIFADAAQGVRHERIFADKLDMLCFSGHKIGALTGTGVLYMSDELMRLVEPSEYGGGTVSEGGYNYVNLVNSVNRFEAGTPNIAGIISLRAALNYLTSLKIENISIYESGLLSFAENELKTINGVSVIGAPDMRAGVISFQMEGFHSYDVASLLDKLGIAVRSGHHCAQPLLNHLGIENAVRVSPAFYNTAEEIEALIAGLRRIRGIKQ